MLLNERQIIEYDDHEKKEHESYRGYFCSHMNGQFEKNKEDKGKGIKIYDNQKETAGDIVTSLVTNKRVINIMVIAKTQSGKTGTMISVIHQFIEHPCVLIPNGHVYIISGLSSTDWVDQTKGRMPHLLSQRVYHQDNLMGTFLKEIKDKKNILIIMDEIQIAAKENQTLHKTFQKAGFYDKQNLFEKDIKIVEFTATPDGTIYDLMKWEENADIIKMDPGEGYIGSFDLLKMNRVKQYKDLKDIGEVQEIKKFLKINPNLQKKYHIIRVNNGKNNKVIDNFKTVFGDKAGYINYFKDDIYDINRKYLGNGPDKDTFIFIKEKMRCAITLEPKIHLGIFYERYSKTINDTVIIQGLVGRGTGYDDNGISVFFTNIKSIKKYEELWISSFKDKKIKWKSNTTKTTSQGTEPKPTYNGMKKMNSKKTGETKNIEKAVVKYFNCFDDVRKAFSTGLDIGNEFINLKYLGNGPKTRTKNDKGFYECMTQTDKNEKVRSAEYFNNLEKQNNWGFRKGDSKNLYRCYPCYSDINDPKTLKWLVVYYKTE